jgi:hypothetical protein
MPKEIGVAATAAKHLNRQFMNGNPIAADYE